MITLSEGWLCNQFDIMPIWQGKYRLEIGDCQWWPPKWRGSKWKINNLELFVSVYHFFQCSCYCSTGGWLPRWKMTGDRNLCLFPTNHHCTNNLESTPYLFGIISKYCHILQNKFKKYFVWNHIPILNLQQSRALLLILACPLFTIIPYSLMITVLWAQIPEDTGDAEVYYYYN